MDEALVIVMPDLLGGSRIFLFDLINPVRDGVIFCHAKVSGSMLWREMFVGRKDVGLKAAFLG